MNPSLIWLGAALFVWGIGEGMFFLFQPIYLQQWGADPIEIGLILGGMGATMTLAHIPAGHLSDRLGRRPMMLAAWITGTLATFIMAAATHLMMFVVGMLLYGFTAFVVSPLDSYVTAARGNWSVGRALTFIGMAFNAGAVLGPFSGGWIADRFGLRAVYFLAAGLFVLSTTLVWSIRPQPRDHHDPANPPMRLWANRRYLTVLAIYFTVAFATYVPQPLTPNFLQNQRRLSLTRIGQLGSVGGLGNTAFNFLLGQLEARSGFVLGQVSVAAFALIMWRGTGFEWFALAYFLLGGYRALRGLGVAQVRPLVHESQMGLAYGVAEMLGSLTTLLAPPVAGFLYARQPTLMYPVGLALIGLGIIISLVFVPRSEKLPIPIELTVDP